MGFSTNPPKKLIFAGGSPATKYLLRLLGQAIEELRLCARQHCGGPRAVGGVLRAGALLLAPGGGLCGERSMASSH